MLKGGMTMNNSNCERRVAESAPARSVQLADDLVKLQKTSGVVLVAVDLGERSVDALVSARDLAYAMGFALRLVHAVVVPLKFDSPTPDTQPRTLDVPSFLDGVRECVQDWAVQEAGVQVEAAAIRVGLGDPLEIIVKEAKDVDVELVVMGTQLHEVTRSRSAMLHALIRRCPRPLLYVGP